jgi:hypothetical protein
MKKLAFFFVLASFLASAQTKPAGKNKYQLVDYKRL